MTRTFGQWSEWQPPVDLSFFVDQEAFLFGGRETQTGLVPGGDTATLSDALASTLKAGGGDDVPLGFFEDVFHASAAEVTGDGAQVFMRHGYSAVNFNGTQYANRLDVPITFPQTNWTTIPEQYRDATTVAGMVQFESTTTTFVGWNNSTVSNLDLFLYAADTDLTTFTQGTEFTPPTSLSFAVGVRPKMPTIDLVNPPLTYTGPTLRYSDLTILNTFSMNASITGPTAPYSDDYVVTDSQPFDIPLSSVHEMDISVVLTSKLTGPDSFAMQSLADENMDFGAALGTYFPGVWYAGFTQLPFNPEIKFRTSRWRYWFFDWAQGIPHIRDTGRANTGPNAVNFW